MITTYRVIDGKLSEWSSVKFTDDKIASLTQNLGVLFATTETGIVWLSFDKGETWQLQSELAEKIIRDYRLMLEDLRKDHERSRADLALYRERQLQLIYNKMDDETYSELDRLGIVKGLKERL